MKTLLAFLVLFQLFPKTICIDGIKRGDRDYVYFLTHKEKGSEIKVDCSSFIHQLEFKNSDLEFHYYLNEEECWSIVQFYGPWQSGERCISLFENYFSLHFCDQLP